MLGATLIEHEVGFLVGFCLRRGGDG